MMSLSVTKLLLVTDYLHILLIILISSEEKVFHV